MALLIRTLLIWLLVLAIPAQGAAAATMAFCGPNHHGGEPTRAMEASQSSDHAHHAEDGAQVDGHAVDAEATDDAFSAQDASTVAEASPAAKQKCSACASCCSLGAILSTVPVIPDADSAATVFAAVVPTVDSIAADGPHRPPRNVFV